MAPADETRREPSADPLVGAELDGRYRIGERIAKGGMGAIYEGTHLELGRRVAIKVLSDSFANDREAVERFQREARASSRIQHPNIVAVLDLGRLETGEPFLVMERLEGEDLCDRIAREAPMSATEVVELLAPVASALDAVHAEGLLHRDIKPGNVFLAERGDAVTPKLLDFGLAALREAPDHERLTREGMVVGTPHYVSPEAAEGKPLDARADVYSLAVMAFEMLSGVLPFDGEKPMALLYAKVRRPAPSLSARTERRFDPVLENVIARSLSRNPEKRPSSAGELVRLIRDAAAQMDDATQVDLPRAGEGVHPEDASRLSRILPSDRMTFSLPLHGLPERWRFVGACAVAAIALVFSWTWLAGGGDGGEERIAGAEIAAGRAVEETARRADPDLVVPDAVDVEAAALPRGVEAPTEEALREPATEGPSPSADTDRPRPGDRRARGDRAATATSRLEEPPAGQAPVAATPATGTSPDEGAGPDPERATALARDAGTALLRGQFPRARSLYRQATYSDPRLASAWRGLGVANERMGLSPEAIAAYRRYLMLAPTAPDAAQVRGRVARLGGGAE